MATATVSQVQALYVGYLGRAGDQAGLDFWLDAIRNDVSTLESVALGFTLSEEYQGLYGGLPVEEFVATVYRNVLGRDPDEEGLAFWVNEIGNGVISADTLVASMINSLGEVDQRTIDNKIFVANTYTVAAGDNYTPAAGARIVADVSSDPASVSAALEMLEDGSLPGAVPGLALFNAIAAAEAELAGYGEQLATDFPDWDADDSGEVSLTEAQGALDSAIAARAAIGGGETTNVLAARLDTAEANYANARAAAVAQQGGNQAVTEYEAAVEASLALEENDPADEAAAQAGFNAAIGSSATVSYASLDALTAAAVTDYATLYAALSDPATASAERADLVEAVSGLSFGQQVAALAANDLAITEADAAVTATEGAVAALGSAGTSYLATSQARIVAMDLLEDAQEADAAVAAIQPIVDQFSSLDRAVDTAETAFSTYLAANPNVNYDELDDGAAAGSTGNDVFVFAEAPTTADFAIANFGAQGNDSLVIGGAFAYNEGATSAGDNNVSEFFIVQGAAGAQIVIETTPFASSSVTAGTNGSITASPDAAVITLTGVSADELQFSNGVISHVA